ncbi:MAG: hypothetical protein JNL74_14130 [Fibrobacteres bacterium]|nr:hypothetical protein [Fibrobacterota bacterium]
MILTTTVSERDSDFKKGFLSNISPMTVSEKFIVRYLWTGPIYFIAFQIMFMLICFIDKSIIMSLGVPYFPVKPYSPEEFWQVGKLSMIGPYLVCHIAFFTLGQLFKKHSFAYTILFLSVVIFLTVSLDMVNRYLAVRGTDITWGAGDSVINTLNWVLSKPTKLVWLNQIFAYLVVFPSLFVASYKLTKEREL